MIPVLSIVSTINDAVAIVAALTPLVKNALMSGQTEVSDADVQAARDRLNASIAALDAQIAASQAAKAGTATP